MILTCRGVVEKFSGWRVPLLKRNYPTKDEQRRSDQWDQNEFRNASIFGQEAMFCINETRICNSQVERNYQQ